MNLQQERDKLFEIFLNRKYLNSFRKPAEMHGDNIGPMALEIFIKSQCPNNCNYCYLKKHENDLYPIELQNNDLLKQNLQLLIDWYITNKFYADIHLFSGDILCNGFLFELLDIIYDNFIKDPFSNYKPKNIIIPEDGKFLNNQDLIDKVNQYIDKFNNNLQIKLIFSISIDGCMVGSDRNHTYSDEYVDNLFNFLIRNKLDVHPMISAETIEQWKENYLWWMDHAPDYIKRELGALEVRNNNWTKEKIQSYLDYLNFRLEYDFEHIFNKDLNLFAHYIVGNNTSSVDGYNTFRLPRMTKEDKFQDWQGFSCTLTNHLCIRLGDLAIVPCHRTSYPSYVVANAIVEDNKITGFECKNYEILSAVHAWNRFTGPKCRDCAIRHWCMGFCAGASFEDSHDMFMPSETVCNLLRAKINFLLIKYKQMGLFPYIKKNFQENGEKEIELMENQIKLIQKQEEISCLNF